MTFWRDDYQALMLDFGVVVEDAHGTRTRGILSEQDTVLNDGNGDVVVRATVLVLPVGVLDGLGRGDILRTWMPDAPVAALSWKVRDLLVRDDGSPLRVVLAAA